MSNIRHKGRNCLNKDSNLAPLDGFGKRDLNFLIDFLNDEVELHCCSPLKIKVCALQFDIPDLENTELKHNIFYSSTRPFNTCPIF